MKLYSFISSIFLIVVIFSTNTLQAQKAVDTLVAWQNYQKADSLLTGKKNYKESIALFEKAVPIYKKAKAWDRVASCYNKVSENQWRSRVLDGSLVSANKALEICTTYLGENHPEEANAYDNLGNYYQKKSDYKNVLAYFKKALQIRKTIFPEHHLSIADSYNNIGIFYYYIGKSKESLKYYEKALTIYQKTLDPEDIKIAHVYNNISGSYDQIEKYDLALVFSEKSLAIKIKVSEKDAIEIGIGYLNISLTYYHMNQLNLSLAYAQKAILIATKNKHEALLADLYDVLSLIYLKTGEYNKGLEYSKKSLKITKEVYGNNNPNTATGLLNMANFLRDEEAEKKLTLYSDALRIYKKTREVNNKYISTIYNNIGDIYVEKKEYETALTYYEKSLTIVENYLENYHFDKILVYINLAILYYEKEEYDTAIDFYTKTLNAIDTSGNLSEYTPQSYIGIANIYYKQKEYKKALAYYDKALTSNTKENKTPTTFNPVDYYFLNQLFETLLQKAKTLHRLYEIHQRTEDRDQSMQIYRNLDLLVDHIRQSYQNYDDKIKLAELAKEMYEHAVQLHFYSYEQTNTITDLEKAFYYAEKSKSNTLKELLNQTNAKDFSILPKKVIELESVLKVNKAFYQSQIATQQAKDSIDIAYVEEYEDKLFDTNRRQDSLTQVLEKEYPAYYQLKHGKKFISIPEIQSKINEQTTVLEFVVADSTTYAFTISKNNFSVKEMATPSLSEHLSLFKKAIVDKDIRVHKQLGHTIYTELMAPIKDQLIEDRLIIIPDGALWQLNFDSLITQETSSKNPVQLPYLLQDYAISYANAANLLFNPIQHSNIAKEEQEDCLAFSFSDSTAIADTKTMSLATLRDSGDDLPGTRREIKAIADILDGQYFYGSEAIESNFKKNAKNYNILHLALHGDIDNEHPQNSKLFFTKSRDTLDDNLLYAHELFSLDIPSELVVLSACNTGAGKIAEGEGIMSLGNAFQYAGAKSLLLTSWEVSDQTTPELMKYFYTNLKDGMDKTKALQQAKLSYLQDADPNRTLPFYWSGFYLVGDAAPIHFENNTLVYWGVGLGLLVIIFVLLFLVRRRKVV